VNRLTHSVVDVATCLAGEASGSSAGSCQQEELDALEAWLAWRLGPEGWQPSVHPRFAAYDAAVRALAAAALAMYRDDMATRARLSGR
jgi:hypothetical protein